MNNDALLEILSSWPPDHTHEPADFFDRKKRLTASRRLASQKAINRRKGEALAGAYPGPSPKDPKIPILLMASRAPTTAGQGSWTLLLPWDCVLPVWYSLMHYPLSTGGNPRFGGLQEKRQMAFEQGMPWYPGDCPGTKAGFEWELLEREWKKQEWERRPKGRRAEFDSVDLGHGKKGEIGMGWACDWERLFQGLLTLSQDTTDDKTPASTSQGKAATDSAPAKSTSTSKEPSNSTKTTQDSQCQSQSESVTPPISIHHLASPLSSPAPISPRALVPIHLRLVTAGHPTRAARIYRLPTTNPELRAQWLALAHPSQKNSKNKTAKDLRFMPIAKNAAPHERAQQLARRLLPQTSADTASLAEKVLPKPGDEDYPCVPEEIDLIGFVTTGNYNLGEGKCEAIGNVAVAKVLGEGITVTKAERDLCIVRESGQRVGRVARWKFV